jgi:protein-S-isoprenylcysteine O-methyltransferase Ste14
MSSLKLIILSVVATLFFLAIAIVAEGGFAAFFSHPALTVIAITTLLLAVASGLTKGNISPGEREDRSNRWVLAVFAVLGVLSAFIPAYTDRIDFWTLDGDTVRWIGVVLFVAGGALRLWPVFVLGNRFSGLVAIQPGHTLVTTGLYSVIRHPSYLGLLVNSLGWELAFRSSIGLILALLNLVPIIGRINAEERLLISQFGSEYEALRARTARLIPGIY